MRVLSRRFRRLYLDGLKDLYGRGDLTLSGRCRELAEPKPWRRLLAALGDKEWVVYAKEPCDSAHILKYLSRYVYRVAISNHRLVALEDGQVTFRYKDYKRGRRLRTRTLDAVEFLRRLMLHILPKGLHKVRYFGWMANRHRSQKLAQCRPLVHDQGFRGHADVQEGSVQLVNRGGGRRHRGALHQPPVRRLCLSPRQGRTVTRPHSILQQSPGLRPTGDKPGSKGTSAMVSALLRRPWTFCFSTRTICDPNGLRRAHHPDAGS